MTKLAGMTMASRQGRADHGVSSWYGDTAGRSRPHGGIDYYWLTGDPVGSKRIYAAAPGTAYDLGYSSTMGWGVEVVHSSRAKTQYWHMAGRTAISNGQTVDGLTYLGSMGDTGTEAAPGQVHLHFELYIDGIRVDPWPYFSTDLPGTPGGDVIDYAYGLTTEAQLAAQKALTRLGFYDGPEDGQFGHYSVLGFQEYLGRGGLGLLDPDYSYDGIPGYYYGVAVQQLAARYGYTGPIDGDPGEYTSAGLERWAADVLAVSPEPPEPERPAEDPWRYEWVPGVGRFASYGFPDHAWRTREIDGIVVHHAAALDAWGYLSNPNDRTSHSTYHIANDGLLGGVVHPSKRPTSTGNSIDERAVTVEIDNEATGGTWPISDAAIEALLRLIVEQADELGLTRIVEYRVGLSVGEGEFFVAWHSQFSATACPGPYLLDRLAGIVVEANRRLEERHRGPEPVEPEPVPETPDEPDEPAEPDEPERPVESPREPRPAEDERITEEVGSMVTEAAKNVALSERGRAFLWWTLLIVGTTLLGVQAWFAGIKVIPPDWYYGASNVALVVLPVVALLARANMPSRNQETAERAVEREAKKGDPEAIDILSRWRDR